MDKRVGIGLVGLTALAVSGNFILALPLSAEDGSDILGLLVAIGASFLLFGVFYPIVSKLLNIEPKSIKSSVRPLYIAFIIILMGIITFIGIKTLISFAKFIYDVVLPERSLGFIFIVIFLTALFIASKNIKAVSKMGTVVFGVCMLLCLIIFLLSLGDMSLKYLFPKNEVVLGDVYLRAKKIFLSAFLEAFVLISALLGSGGSKKSVTLGNAAGAVLIIFCCLNTILVFGGGFAATLDYPYVSAVKAVGNRDIFSGTEGFLYISVFFSCIVKASLAFLGIRCLSKKLIEMKK